MTPPPPLPLIGGLLGIDFLGAGATWAGWEAAGHDGLAPALAVLLVASPLGLLIALYAPLPVARRIGRRSGITHLGSAADRGLPRLRRLVTEVDHVVTTGDLTVVGVVPLEERFKRDLRWFAGALARGSTDPVARAIAKLSARGRPTDVSQGTAHELQGAVDRHPVRIALNGSGGGDHPPVGTTVRVDVDLRPMGHITVADEVRKQAAHCFDALRDEGIEPVLVSTTLAEHDLARIAELAGVTEYHHGPDAVAVLESRDATTGVLRAAARGGTDGDVAGETVLPGDPGEDTTIRCADPSIEAVVASLRHVRRLRRARRIAQVCAIAAILIAAPLAAAGLLPLARAALLAGASVLLVAIVATSATLGGTSDGD
jgi:cation transport ATPase